MKARPENFDLQTVVAIAAGMLLLATIGIGVGKDIAASWERDTNEHQGWYGVGVDRTGQDRGKGQAVPSPDTRQVPQTRPQGGVPATSPAAAVSRLQGGTPDRARGGTVRVVSGERRLLDAIAQVESGRDDSKIGDNGKAHGRYQIWRNFWLDGGGKASDYPAAAHNREKAEAVVLAYWKRYGAESDESRARMINGGPNGMKKAATAKYWAKVKRELGR